MDSKVKYGQEHGKNLIKIAKKILNNQDLCKLLVNTNLDPLNNKDEINGMQLLNKNVRVVPLLGRDEQLSDTKLVLLYTDGELSESNSDNEVMTFIVSIYCPFQQWLITGEDLRPYKIMSEVRKSLQDKRLNGLGEIKYTGFNFSTLTEEMGNFVMEFRIYAFS